MGDIVINILSYTIGFWMIGATISWGAIFLSMLFGCKMTKDPWESPLSVFLMWVVGVVAYVIGIFVRYSDSLP